MIEAALSFVGLGVQPPSASWGTLVRSGYDRIYDYPGYAIFPGLAMVITIWALNALGDRLGADPATRALTQ
jgi:ABC-type dipeptide/oligopeptide/nickel transport system permease subunit